MLKLNKIYNIDCIEGLNKLNDESIDLVITSPPYNVDIDYDSYKDNINYNKYLNWLQKVFKLCYNKLKSGGRLCINVGDKNNGLIPTHSHLIQRLTARLDYMMYTSIIWNKNTVSNRASWGSYLKPSCPSFPSPIEYILVFYKDSKKLTCSGTSDLTKDEFIKYAYALWNITPETRMKEYEHPAMFPVEIPYRLIKMFSYPGAVVLDIFSGLGTTCLTASKLKRKYIGFELSTTYADLSRIRIEKESLQLELF